MTIGIIIAVVRAPAGLGFLVPRLSREARRAASTAPWAWASAPAARPPASIGRLFSKSFGTSRKATNKSAETGRRGRGKLPL